MSYVLTPDQRERAQRAFVDSKRSLDPKTRKVCAKMLKLSRHRVIGAWIQEREALSGLVHVVLARAPPRASSPSP